MKRVVFYGVLWGAIWGMAFTAGFFRGRLYQVKHPFGVDTTDVPPCRKDTCNALCLEQPEVVYRVCAGEGGGDATRGAPAQGRSL